LSSEYDMSAIPYRETQVLHSESAAKTYWKEMIEIWDEILPEVRRISRYESPFGMMSFTSTFRDMIESN
ncbi:hypothetical protein R2R70_06000, partial [Cobetia sp. SIMBA_158]|uniref:hypothetical protein n=1 Tax=Cobetia sp. SIMBA_158 TaxID=3081617 RepID=UPI00397ED2D1